MLFAGTTAMFAWDADQTPRVSFRYCCKMIYSAACPGCIQQNNRPIQLSYLPCVPALTISPLLMRPTFDIIFCDIAMLPAGDTISAQHACKHSLVRLSHQLQCGSPNCKIRHRSIPHFYLPWYSTYGGKFGRLLCPQGSWIDKIHFLK